MLERVIGEAYTAGVAVDSPQMRAAASLLGAFESSVEAQATAPAPKADKVGAAPCHARPARAARLSLLPCATAADATWRLHPRRRRRRWTLSLPTSTRSRGWTPSTTTTAATRGGSNYVCIRNYACFLNHLL